VKPTGETEANVDKKYFDQRMLAFLIKELDNRSGFEFERFVAELLRNKYGSTKWPPRNGSDGKIDFASDDYLFQIYGSERPRGSVQYMRQKLNAVSIMLKTAKESGLKATKVVFLTNVHPDSGMARLMLKAQKSGVQIKDVDQTAEFLYDVYYPFDQLARYFYRKCGTFAEESWPYDIDEKAFVDNFDFVREGNLSSQARPESKEKCLQYISQEVTHGPVICVGCYGMGKTVLSKMLFKKWHISRSQVYPVYIALTHRHLKDFSGNALYRQMADEVKPQLIEPNEGKEASQSVDVFDEEKFMKNIRRMIDNRKMLLVLDGIDESVSEREELLGFLKSIFAKNLMVFLTCRLEYRPFFDAYQALRLDKRPHAFIELCEWDKPQWKVYINGLLSQFPTKRKLIVSFSKKLKSETYATLPNRPLFLKMLSDLEINNETDISILPELSSNLAEIYFKFLKWKIRDDYNRKGGVYDFDLKKFEEECFFLLRDIAFLEYQSAFEQRDSQVTLKSIQKICSERKFVELSEEYIGKVLLRSSLFAILKRTIEDNFIFSHKSFMEFLVAFSLADSLFHDSNPKKARCGEIWRCFQTHEVSRHFVNEVERVRATRKLDPEKGNEFLVNAFNEVVAERMRGDLKKYDERFQEVLYYIGKLEVGSPKLVKVLQRIVTNRNQFHPIYFRSASLSLSRILGDAYCERYVLYLIKDLKSKGRDFGLNQDIQIRYYGRATLRRILKEDIDEYISKRNLSSIISLKILTFFTAIPPTDEDYTSLKAYLDRVSSASLQQKHTNIQTVCKAISGMLNVKKKA
jgi:hypothetical protein